MTAGSDDAARDDGAVSQELPEVTDATTGVDLAQAPGEHHGVPASDLSDEDLERQGAHAHETRNWVFLHGTAEQFRTHTERMLELEQEYLRRHPQRTWQGVEAGGQRGDERDFLQRFATMPGGRMHKLEAHQVARQIGLRPERVAALHRQDPPLLTTEGNDRVLTEAGRAWLSTQPTTPTLPG